MERPSLYVAFDIGIKNMAVCAVLLDGTIKAWRTLPLMEGMVRPSQDVLMETLFEHLDNLIAEVANHDLHILIENQPSKMNPTMKTIQTWVQSYYALSRHWGAYITNIHLVSPSQKLHGHAHKTGIEGKGYSFNKKEAVALMRAYLKDAPKWRAYFEASKKKDDLADAACHAIAWIRRQGTALEAVHDVPLNECSLSL